MKNEESLEDKGDDRNLVKPSDMMSPLEEESVPTVSNSRLPLELLGDSPLRLIIVGHNPSQKAWSMGHFYANPTNWMWRILRESGIAPTSIRGAEDDHWMPKIAGVGFTDVGSGFPGTDSSKFKSSDFEQWIPKFYDRLKNHVHRASISIGCNSGTCGAPCVIAFSGKRQFQELFPSSTPKPGPKKGRVSPRKKENIESANIKKQKKSHNNVRLQSKKPKLVPFGCQEILPLDWPLPLSVHVWVLPSTSGAAPMTREARYGPWKDLARGLEKIPWPRNVKCTCS